MTDTSHETPNPQNPSSTPTTPSSRSSQGPEPTATSGPEKDVDDWATGGEPATGPQLSYLETLAREAGEQVPDDLTKADASKLIDRLQGRSPRTAGPGQQAFDAEPSRQGDEVSDRTAQEAAPGAAGDSA